METSPSYPESNRPSRAFSRILGSELKTRSLWLIRLRWTVPPAVVASVVAASALNYQIHPTALLTTAGWILCYNLVLWAWAHHLKPSEWQNPSGVRKFIFWQLGLDYLAILTLIHLTGGIVSPLLYFCVFHVLFSAVLLPGLSTYGFTAVAVAGVTFITFGEWYGWIDHHSLSVDAAPLIPSSFSRVSLYLFFFAATLSITAWLATKVMGVFFQRMLLLDARSEALAAGMVGIGIYNSQAYKTTENFTEERSRFMMRAAHNLRAPLSAVLSMLELVRGKHLGPLTPDQSEYLRRVDRRIHTMLDMINELMHLSTTRSRQPLPQKDLDTGWLGGRLERTFQNEAAERTIDFTVTVENDSPPVSGNSEQIEQMLENLVSNAIKYTPDGGWVKVTFSGAPGNRIAIRIADSGIGIPEKDQSRLFTEFFRAENAREKQEMGTGLGLSIVKEIVDAHQGTIQVDSRENQGTTVLVTLPAVRTAGEEKE